MGINIMNKTTEEKLIQAAIEGMKNGFTGTNRPEDRRFGAAVLTTKGNIYSSGAYFSCFMQNKLL